MYYFMSTSFRIMSVSSETLVYSMCLQTLYLVGWVVADVNYCNEIASKLRRVDMHCFSWHMRT
jgi:hypothetical protein